MDDAARVPAVFRVMLGEEAWTVKEDGRAAAASSFASKREAVAEARRRAQQRPLACVVVHYADRSVESQTLFHGEPRPTRTWRSFPPAGGASPSRRARRPPRGRAR